MSELETLHYLCIGCPLGCRLEVDEDPNSHAIVEVRGFSCRRGKDYAIQEHTEPRRTVTTTVAIDHARWARLPVRSDKPAPKEMVLPICHALRMVRVTAPVNMGDVIATDVAGSGVNMIAARDMAALSA